MRNASTRRRAALVGIALVTALLTGCGRNTANTVLIPTGIRPAPAVPAGAIYGYVAFDPQNTPDLASAPYPTTRIDVLSGGALVTHGFLPIDSRRFELDGVPPGTYQVVVSSPVFQSATRPAVVVRDHPVDSGNFTLAINPNAFTTITLALLGDLPNFGLDQLGTGESYFDQSALGVWHYPNSLYPGGAAIPAGTYRFKLVTDISSSLDHLIGWGGSDQDTLTAPFTAQRVKQGSDPATDLVVRFPTTAVYTIVLDERRQTLDITLASSGSAHH